MTHTLSQHLINSQCLNEYSQRLKNGQTLPCDEHMGWDFFHLCGKHKTGSPLASSGKVTPDQNCPPIPPLPLSTFITKGLFFKVGQKLRSTPENSTANLSISKPYSRLQQKPLKNFWSADIDLLYTDLTHKPTAATLPTSGPWTFLTGYNPRVFTLLQSRKANQGFQKVKSSGSQEFTESCLACFCTLFLKPQKLTERNKIDVINTFPHFAPKSQSKGSQGESTKTQLLKLKDVLRRRNSNKPPLFREKAKPLALPDLKKAGWGSCPSATKSQDYQSVARSGPVFEKYGLNNTPLSQTKASKLGYSVPCISDRSSKRLPFYSYSLNWKQVGAFAFSSNKHSTLMSGSQAETKEQRIPIKTSSRDPLEKTSGKLITPYFEKVNTLRLNNQVVAKGQPLLPCDSGARLNLKVRSIQAPSNGNCPLWGILLFSREELAFLNLRSILSTLLKALHVCLFAALNNKRILFVGDPSPLAQEHQQRLLSSFIGCQVKALSTKVTERLPPLPPFLKPDLLKASTLFSEVSPKAHKIQPPSKITSFDTRLPSAARLTSSATTFDRAVLRHDKTVKKEGAMRNPFLSHLYGLIAHSSSLCPSIVINTRTKHMEPLDNSMNLGALSQLNVQESSALANYDLRQTLCLSPCPQLGIGRLGRIVSPLCINAKQGLYLPAVTAESQGKGSRKLQGAVISERLGKDDVSQNLGSESEHKSSTLHSCKVTRSVVTPQLTQSNKDTIDLSKPFFYNPMAKLVSKAGIRNSQWTATLAQSTHGLIGGFFSNGLARYEQSLASTTKLNILMDGSESWMNYLAYPEIGKADFGNLNNPTPAEESTGVSFKLTQSKSEKSSAKGQNTTPLTDLRNLCETQELQIVEPLCINAKQKLEITAGGKASHLIKSKDDLFFEKPFFEYIKPSRLLNAMDKTTDGLRNAIYSPVPKKKGWAIGKQDLVRYPTRDKRKGCFASQSFRGQIPNFCDKHKTPLRKRLFQKATQNHYQGILNHCLYSLEVTDMHNPWLKEADLVFFTNPEKSKALLNQINRLGIPTLGIVNSGSNLAFPFRSVKGPSLLSSSPTLTYPIVGNSDSLHFLRMILAKFLCVLNRERKN